MNNEEQVCKKYKTLGSNKISACRSWGAALAFPVNETDNWQTGQAEDSNRQMRHEINMGETYWQPGGASSFWLCYIRAQPTVTAKHKNCGWLCGYSHIGTDLEVKAKPQWHQETSTAKHINSKTKRHQNTAIANPSDIKIQWQQIRVIRWVTSKHINNQTQFHENTVTAKPERLVTRWLYGQMGTVLVVKANASDIKTHQQPKPSFMKTQWQQNRRDQWHAGCTAKWELMPLCRGLSLLPPGFLKPLRWRWLWTYGMVTMFDNDDKNQEGWFYPTCQKTFTGLVGSTKFLSSEHWLPSVNVNFFLRHFFQT